MKPLPIFACFLLASTAQAWDVNGHIMIGMIAEKHLTPEARAGIQELLGKTPISDEYICTWADIIRNSSTYDKKYPNHRTWHYINLELAFKKEEYQPKVSDDDVHGAIERYRKLVTDGSLSAEDRKEALMFVVHFLQDMHQPMHCGNRNDDKGGNQQPIRSFDGVIEDKLNLHWIWDKHLVQFLQKGLTNEDYARRLDAEITEEERANWRAGTVAQWIWESHELTVKYAYTFSDGSKMPFEDAPVHLTIENYIQERSHIAKKQLQKGGIRLASILNQIFRKE